MYSHISADNKAIAECMYSLVTILVLQCVINTVTITKIVKYLKPIIIVNAGIIFVSAMLLEQHPSVVIVVAAFNTGTFTNITRIGFNELINNIYQNTNRTIWSSKYVQLAALIGGIAAIGILILPELSIRLVVYIQMLAAIIIVVTDMYQVNLFKRYVAID